MTGRRVPGHTLEHEGAPHDDMGRLIQGGWGSTAGPGRALCSCQELSPVLTSGSARQRWHREHKAQVLAERDA